MAICQEFEFLYHGMVLADVLGKGKGKVTQKNGSGDISPLVECLLITYM